MRRLIVLSAFVLACGSSSKNETGLSGTIGGRPLSVSEVRAIRAGTGTTPCSLPNPLGGGALSFGVSALAIDIASYANACADYGGQCTLHANGQNVTIIFAKLGPTGAEPTLVPGTYTVQSSPTTALPDGAGLLTVAYAQALATGAAPTCVGTPSPAVTGGSLRLDQVSAAAVTGHVDLTFQDGSAVAGDFSATVCPGAGPDICALATSQSLCTLPPVCQP